MFSASAQFYDLIYSSLKDYGGETAQIAGHHDPKGLSDRGLFVARARSN